MSARPKLHPHTPRLGFIGLGWIGRKRLDALDPATFEAAAFAEADSSRLQAVAQTYPGAIAAERVEAILDADLDGVVIATPNGLHAQQAIACLERGIPVFCQKPLATRLADVERVVATARDVDRLLGIDFCYRHVSGMQELRRRLRAGEIGDVIAVDLTFHNAYGPDQSWCQDRRLAGGGCLMDLGVHLLDLSLWLQGMPPTERVRSRLFAQGTPVQAGDAVEDLAFAEFIQANGAIVRLACSWHAHIGQGAIIQIAIAGTRGGARWANVHGSFYDFELDLIHGTHRERLSDGESGDWGPRALQAWVEQLRIGNRFDADTNDIIRSAALIEEVYRA